VARDDVKAFCIPNSYKVVANVPYQITSQLFRLFLEEVETRPTCIVTMVQKEVAQRICASRGDMSLLAVSIQYYGVPKLISYVSKGNFWPMPKVDSAVIKIDLAKSKEQRAKSKPDNGGLQTTDDGRQTTNDLAGLRPSILTEMNLPTGQTGAERDKYFFSVVKAAFAHKRKQAWRNISEGLGLPSDVVKKVLKEVVGNESVRAQDVIVEEWRRIAISLKSS
jgi:16S rRNA (adenine1518-N6/adenine1519-N6)-dimethyltransferase